MNPTSTGSTYSSHQDNKRHIHGAVMGVAAQPKTQQEHTSAANDGGRSLFMCLYARRADKWQPCSGSLPSERTDARACQGLSQVIVPGKRQQDDRRPLLYIQILNP